MSSNMQRQAVRLSQSKKCIVGTRLEGQAVLDSTTLAIAEHEGKIFYTDTNKILLPGNNGDTLRIPLVMYQHSNKNTCIHQKPRVRRGKCMKKGQILAYGAIGGKLALGETYNHKD
ncbi:putative DNA-directed RNA polymerase [Helianthus anomalus]